MNLRKRVGTFPRSPTTRAAGLLQRVCLCRRTLPVAIVATGACAVLFRSNKSSAAPRGKTAVIVSALSISLGKSFALCTATSMRFSISARSSSAVKIPLRPSLRSNSLGATCSGSPVVRMISVATLTKGRVRASASSTIRVCVNANSLPRVPRTISCCGVS